MSKRQATSELNHDNWDKEDSDSEEKGSFNAASKDVLQNRVIKVAKRRTTQSDSSKSVFNQFGGFNKTQKTSFDFLANLAKTSTPIPATTSVSHTNTTSNLFTKKSIESNISQVPIGLTTTAASNISSTFPSPSSSVFATPKSVSNTVNVPFTTPSAFTGNKESGKTADSKETNLFELPISQSASIFGSTPGTSKSIFSSSNPSNLFKNQTLQTNIQNEYQTKITNKKDGVSNSDKNILYYSKLRKLNTSVLDWIKQHVEDTPVCVLTPIFKDYEKYINQIIDEYENNEEEKSFRSPTKLNNSNENKPVSEPKIGGIDKSGFSTSDINKTSTSESCFAKTFMPSSPASNKMNDTLTGDNPNINKSPLNITESPKTLFSQSIQTSIPKANTSLISNLDTNTKPFSFVSNTSQNPLLSTTNIPSSTSLPSLGTSMFTAKNSSSTPFSFGTAGQFSFSSNISKSAESKQQDEDNDKEDEPPKVEFTPIVEENNVYDKRCKIFFRKDGQYIDNGVCTLYIKKSTDSNKHQLLVRANTTLGTIMLNLILTSSLPTQKMGKNNVMLVCIPKPDMEPPPIPVLIKVKTSEEADELLDTLNKYKN